MHNVLMNFCELHQVVSVLFCIIVVAFLKSMPHMLGICSEENGRVPGWAWPEEGLPVPESETY